MHTDKARLRPRQLERQADIVNTELHPQAEDLIEHLTLDFGTSLLLQAKLLARRRNDDIVLRSHVEEALEIIKQERKQKPWKIWVTVLGGVFFGTGAKGFITELQGTRDPLTISAYVVLAFIGLLMVVGFQR